MQLFETFSSLFYLALIVMAGNQRYQRDVLKGVNGLIGSGPGKW